MTIPLPWVPSYYTLFNVSSANATGTMASSTFSAEYCHDLDHFELDDAAIRREHDGVNPFCMVELTKMLATFVVVTQVLAPRWSRVRLT